MKQLETIKDPIFTHQKGFSNLDFSMILGMPLNEIQNQKLNTTFKTLLDQFMSPKFLETIVMAANQTHKDRAIKWLKAMSHDGTLLPLEIFNVVKTKDCMSARNWIRHYFQITPAEEQADDK